MILAVKNGMGRRDLEDVHLFVKGRTGVAGAEVSKMGQVSRQAVGFGGNQKQRKVITRSNSIYAFLPQVAKHWNSTGYMRAKMSIYHLISNCNKYGTNYSP